MGSRVYPIFQTRNRVRLGYAPFLVSEACLIYLLHRERKPAVDVIKMGRLGRLELLWGSILVFGSPRCINWVEKAMIP